MVTIGLDTAVYCLNDFCGVVQYLIVHPAQNHLTHLGVKPVSSPSSGHRSARLIPLSNISAISTDRLWLNCLLTEFDKVHPFTETQFIISRQVQIEATNGHIGQFEAFHIDLETGAITHLIFHHGHLWDRKLETVPVSTIDTIEGDTIYLKINKSDLLRQ